MKRKKVIGYLRVSTIDQNTEKNETAILRFANQKEFGKVRFVSEKVSGIKSWKNRKLFEVVESMEKGDVMIVPELSRLGRSLVDVLDVLNVLKDKQVKVYSVKENFQLNGDDMQSKMMRTMLSLFSEIERDLISTRTKEGLEAVKASGKQLGRPKGIIGRSKLDKHRGKIIELLNEGVAQAKVARRFGCTPASVGNWLKKHNIEIEPQP
jgi:DNA invertase Pin-like site-specific DNA recombinase